MTERPETTNKNQTQTIPTHIPKQNQLGKNVVLEFGIGMQHSSIADANPEAIPSNQTNHISELHLIGSPNDAA